MRISTTLLSGYLGSGKTTVINRLLANARDRRIAVLVNDFGAVNIDASLIRSQTDQTISLTNGCVCCSIADDLGGAIDAQTGRSDPPEHIVIEASGVAEPARIAKHIGGWPGIALDAVVCVVDAETIGHRVHDKFVGSLVRRQLDAADLLILNKLDLIGSGVEIRAWLRDQAPRGQIIETTFGAVDPDLLLGPSPARRSPTAVYEPETPGHSPHLTSTVWAPATAVDIEALRRVLSDLPQTVHRLKGFVVDSRTDTALLVQLVGRRFSIAAAGPDAPSKARDGPGQIALIGSCNQDDLSEICARLDACVGGGSEVVPGNRAGS